MKLLYGNELAEFIKVRQAKQVRNLRQSWQTLPRLAIIQTRDNPVINTYVGLKQQYGHDILVDVDSHSVDQSQLATLIEELNADPTIHGIILQLPLAEQSQTDEMVNLVAPAKDVDGLGRQASFTPATPLAIDWLLASHNISLTGKRIAIIGRGRLVGAPLEELWRSQGLDITMFDADNPAGNQLSQFDVIATAVGKPGLILADYIKPGAVVIDAGTASDSGVIRGDVADEVYERDDIIATPRRGGIGPLTVAALFDNVISAARTTTLGR